MLWLIRGLPGTGKTTYARSLGCLVVEADQFCMKDGIYQYNHGRMARAHVWCLKQVQDAICMDMDIAVSNTFSYLKFMKPYIEFSRKHGCSVTIVECAREYGSTHRIPGEVVARMRATWEAVPEEWLKDLRLVVISGWNVAEERTRIGTGSSEQWFTVAMGHS